MNLDLTGRTALVTGGSRGIGLAIGRQLAAEGCHLCLVARSIADLKKAAETIRERWPVNVRTFSFDLSDPAARDELVKSCPEIDILIVVNVAQVPDEWSQSLHKLGYRRGGDLSPGHHFFKRDAGSVRTHKVHVCHQGHPNISEQLRFRDHLRRHPADRLRYQELKLKLERENTRGIREYLSGKAPFINSILGQST